MSSDRELLIKIATMTREFFRVEFEKGPTFRSKSVLSEIVTLLKKAGLYPA